MALFRRPAVPLPLPAQLSPDETKALMAYQLIHARINETDAKMWQVPSLTLTAQAFLLTITLSADFKVGSHIAGASMGVLISALSLQLMMKHRFFHGLDTAMLKHLEQRYDLYKVASFDWPAGVDGPSKNWVTRRKSVRVWTFGLAAIGLANAALIPAFIFYPKWF